MDFIDIITFFFIGVGLSFDSFAVSVSCGLVKKEMYFRQALPIAFSFAFFQAFFPVIGWAAGISLHDHIRSVDHWIAFTLLAVIGIKMIVEGTGSKGTPESIDPFKISVILSLSVATSIDALVVGISFGLLETPIIFPVIIIGGVTFFASMLGMLFGKSIPAKLSYHSLILGGIILIIIGIKILVEHLWFH